MRIEFQRQSIASSIELTGAGIHTGETATVRMTPGQRGIIFRHEGNEFMAHPSSVSKTPRSTWLGTVRTVEHIMSAFAAHEITDIEVELIGPEIPVLDGGSALFFEAIASTGLSGLGKTKSCSLFGRVQIGKDTCRISIAAGSGRWRYQFVSGERFPGDLSVEFAFGIDSYRQLVAPARTWIFEEEIEGIRCAGLGKGATESNTLVIGLRGYRNDPMFPDEPARHKLLDCMGDIALAGVPLSRLDVMAEATGHEMNVQAASRLAEICTWE